jgi:hypothetical protein
VEEIQNLDLIKKVRKVRKEALVWGSKGQEGRISFFK